MKQVKFFLVVLMTVMMGVSVTSCMKGEDNNIIQRIDFVRVNQYDLPISFKTWENVKLIPNQMLMSAKESMALIYYQYDRSTITENSKSITISLLSDPNYIKESSVLTTSTGLIASAPVLTLEPTTVNGVLKGGFFDKNTILVPIAYKTKGYDKPEDMTIEQGRHSFDLVYDKETGFDGRVLTFRLYHRAEKIMDGDKEVERKDNTYEYRAFNMAHIISGLSSKPEKVKIVVDYNEDNDKLEQGKEKDFFLNDYSKITN